MILIESFNHLCLRTGIQSVCVLIINDVIEDPVITQSSHCLLIKSHLSLTVIKTYRIM